MSKIKVSYNTNISQGRSLKPGG